MSDFPAPSSTAYVETLPCWQGSASNGNGRFAVLRSVQWRVNLGILPSSSVDDLRHVTADIRRRYANLRRQLLVDPHALTDRSNTPNLVIDNPLSQNPGSTWGRFFQNAELEKMVDQDLSRLYPEHGSYFHTPGCQGILRRVLLLWCLRNPEYGYRQGMHELLAPLLYVLHVDIEHLSEVRKLYEDHFFDKFDDVSFEETDNKYHFNFKKITDSTEHEEAGSEGSAIKMRSIDELDPNVKNIVLLSDAYGAEGELGIVLSDKFMEHDAFSMFEVLMSGGGNRFVAMADFFSPAPELQGNVIPPVIEASTALYHLLSRIDPSLHSHLTELGVEPQYFALRWFRVLFGREFVLGDLLIIWDEIFMCDNTKLVNNSTEENTESTTFKILASPQGAFIAGIAVSMMLQLRSSLLATEHATSCLQKLLNFPQNIDLKKLIAKAKSLQGLALVDTFKARSSSSSAPPLEMHSPYGPSESTVVRSNTTIISFDSVSPKYSMSLAPNSSYWEQKWRDMNKQESNPTKVKKKGWSQRLRLSYFRRASDSSPAKALEETKIQEVDSSAPQDLLEGLTQELKSSVKREMEKDYCCAEVDAKRQEDGIQKRNFVCLAKDKESFSGIAGGNEKNGDIGANEAEKRSALSSSANENEGTLKNLGESMLQHIRVIESVFQQDNEDSMEKLHKSILVEKGRQVTAAAALEELRKISNLLSNI